MIEFTNLNKYLTSQGFYIDALEGNMSDIPEQCDDVMKIVSMPFVKTILEIGFNSGHSSELMLRTNPHVKVVSFDLGEHEYTAKAKQYIDKMYPLRHLLILGNSVQTIPTFHHMQPDARFDLIFIDGGHDYLTARADLGNCRFLSHPMSLVIMDDIVFSTSMMHTAGPTKCWREQKEKRTLEELQHKEYSPGRGHCVGRYIKEETNVISEFQYRDICDIIFVPKNDDNFLSTMFKGCKIYLELKFYGDFILLLDRINVYFKVVSASEDFLVSNHSELLSCKFLISWYSINKNRHHPKLFGIPKGISENIPQLNDHHEIKYMEWCFNKQLHSQLLTSLYRSGFAFMRENIYLKSIQESPLLFVCYTSHSSQRCILDEQLASLGIEKTELVVWESYINKLREHKFVLCPPGIDRYRVWESLMLGTIPIVFSSPYSNELYFDLPVLVINSYRDLLEENLYMEYVNIIKNINNYKYDKLTINYWDTVISN